MSADETIVSLVMIVNFLSCGLVGIMLIRYRNYFPIKERSPFLTLLGLVAIYAAIDLSPACY